MHIFPVSVNYERLFEIRNIADMMVSRHVANLGVIDILKKFNGFKGKKLGRSYVIFGKTISLKDYFASETESAVLTPDRLNQAALKLT